MSHSAEYEKEPDYKQVVQMLIQKTKAGKIDWQETAVPDRFVASIQGVRSLLVEQVENYDESENALYPTLLLTGTNPSGQTLFSHVLTYDADARTLFELAKRIATNEDDRLREVVELLTTL